MASGPITSTQIEGEKVEAVTDSLFLGSKITSHGDRSHEIRCLLLGRKATTNLDSVLESRDITLLTKVHDSEGYGLPSGHTQLWELDCKEGGVPKNWRLWTAVLEKTPESPVDCKIQPVNLKGSRPWILNGRIDAEVETPVIGHLIRSADSLENSLMLGKIEGRRRRGRRRMRWLDGITDAVDVNLGKLRGMVRDTVWRAAVYGVTKSQTQLGNWMTMKLIFIYLPIKP